MKRRRGGIFDAIMSAATYWGQSDRIVPGRPATKKVGFRWLGPFNPNRNNMPLIGFGRIRPTTQAERRVAMTRRAGNDAHPYYMSPPAYPVPNQPNAIHVPGAIVYGREGGQFYQPVRRCPVDYSPQAMEDMASEGLTPRGGIFDGESVGGPVCNFGSPMKQPVPWQRNSPLYPVPEFPGGGRPVPLVSNAPRGPFQGYGSGPDGCF